MGLEYFLGKHEAGVCGIVRSLLCPCRFVKISSGNISSFAPLFVPRMRIGIVNKRKFCGFPHAEEKVVAVVEKDMEILPDKIYTSFSNASVDRRLYFYETLIRTLRYPSKRGSNENYSNDEYQSKIVISLD